MPEGSHISGAAMNNVLLIAVLVRMFVARNDDEDPRATDSISLLFHSASVAEHSSLHTDTCLPVLVSALVLNRMDYCNSLLINLPLIDIQRLQSVQNAAARLIFNLRRCDHITDAHISLHGSACQSELHSRWRH